MLFCIETRIISNTLMFCVSNTKLIRLAFETRIISNTYKIRRCDSWASSRFGSSLAPTAQRIRA